MKHDFFSGHADHYARYRPHYPSALFQFLAAKSPGRTLAWDVATGNGQAAVQLARLFDTVYASDLSSQQLQHAVQCPNITYRHEVAEHCSLPYQSVDLITVATGIHWFQLDAFFEQVQRVLKPGGICAAWGYALSHITPEIDEIMVDVAYRRLRDYWPAPTKLNWEDNYRSLQMPYPELEWPGFEAVAEYTLDDLLNYLFSWSAVQEYIKKNGSNPLEEIEDTLMQAWGTESTIRTVRWPLHGKLCRKFG